MLGWIGKWKKADLAREIEESDIQYNKLAATLRVMAEFVRDDDPRAKVVADEVLSGKVDTRVHDIRLENGELMIAGSHWSSILIARSLGELLLRPDGSRSNYVEMRFNSQMQCDVILTAQRITGETPHALRVKAEAERDALRPVVEHVARWGGAGIGDETRVKWQFDGAVILNARRALGHCTDCNAPREMKCEHRSNSGEP